MTLSRECADLVTCNSPFPYEDKLSVGTRNRNKHSPIFGIQEGCERMESPVCCWRVMRLAVTLFHPLGEKRVERHGSISHRPGLGVRCLSDRSLPSAWPSMIGLMLCCSKLRLHCRAVIRTCGGDEGVSVLVGHISVTRISDAHTFRTSPISFRKQS